MHRPTVLIAAALMAFQLRAAVVSAQTCGICDPDSISPPPAFAELVISVSPFVPPNGSFCYPQIASVTSGGKVRFVNQTTVAHRLVSPPFFDTGVLAPSPGGGAEGGACCQTFPPPFDGTATSFPFTCALHPGTDEFAAIVVCNPAALSGVESPGGSQLPSLVRSLVSPNPAHGPTQISYLIPEPGGVVSLVIYDASGGVVRRLLQTQQGAGTHDVIWDGTNDQGTVAPSGIYWYLVQCGSHHDRGSLVLVH